MTSKLFSVKQNKALRTILIAIILALVVLGTTMCTSADPTAVPEEVVEEPAEEVAEEPAEIPAVQVHGNPQHVLEDAGRSLAKRESIAQWRLVSQCAAAPCRN